MNEAQQTATLATMTDKELKTLVKRLDAQVTGLKADIAYYENMVTLAGAQAEIDRRNEFRKANGREDMCTQTAAEVAAEHAGYYTKTYRIHQAKLITKTRRLVQAAGEMARRLEAVNV
jgi:hypothetical protein